jgi:hypothetical protein
MLRIGGMISVDGFGTKVMFPDNKGSVIRRIAKEAGTRSLPALYSLSFRLPNDCRVNCGFCLAGDVEERRRPHWLGKAEVVLARIDPSAIGLRAISAALSHRTF